MQISDLQADNEESQRNIQQLKKKAQRLTAELQDTKLHLEGQQSRNHDLEKKQRKSVYTNMLTHNKHNFSLLINLPSSHKYRVVLFYCRSNHVNC